MEMSLVQARAFKTISCLDLDHSHSAELLDSSECSVHRFSKVNKCLWSQPHQLKLPVSSHPVGWSQGSLLPLGTSGCSSDPGTWDG